MDSWVKYFIDGSIEIGTDDLIEKKLASWTKGRQDNITKVSISAFSKSTSLEVVNTSWYQFDKYLLSLETNTPYRIARAIQAQIKEPIINNFLCYNKINSSNLFYILNKKSNELSYKIEKEDLDSWITIVLLKNKISCFISPNKGSLNASKSIFK